MLLIFRLRSLVVLLIVLGTVMMIRSTYYALHMTPADIDRALKHTPLRIPASE